MFAVVTGGASGIGYAVAVHLAERGWRLAVLDNNNSGLQALEREVGSHHEFKCVDVADSEALQDCANEFDSSGVGIDLLFVNAGIARPDSLDADESVWTETIAINLTGTVRTARAFERFVGSGSGHGAIVLMASVLGLRGSGSMLSYSVSKAGIVGLATALAQTCVQRGVTVNALAPGPIRTPLLEALSSDETKQLASQVPLGRLGLTRDVAGAVEFFASVDASFITGQVLAIDGGLSSVAYWR